MERNMFGRFAGALKTLPADTDRHPSLLINDDGRNTLYYVPFEHVNPSAKLVLVGISPGPNQMKAANNTCRELLQKELPHDEVAAAAKRAGAFGGDKFRNNLCSMLDHFHVPEWLGLRSSGELFTTHNHLLYSTSVVPHAAYVGGKYLSDSFKTVLKVPAFQECFEDVFVARLPELNPEAKFIALGHVPLAALEWCIEKGHLDRSRVIGAIAHPSGEAGSQTKVFLGEKKAHELKPKDPVRHRMPTFSAHYDLTAESMSSILGRELPRSVVTYS